MTVTSGSGDRLSGLWHHQQSSGHPLRKTVVRMPGPSWSEYRWILKTAPLTKTNTPTVGASTDVDPHVSIVESSPIERNETSDFRAVSVRRMDPVRQAG